MLDATERATIQSILDHFAHAHGNRDIAYVIRRLNFLLSRAGGDLDRPVYRAASDADSIGNR